MPSQSIFCNLSLNHQTFSGMVCVISNAEIIFKERRMAMSSNRDELKRRAGERAVDYVEDGNLVGLGTGSTTLFAIKEIGRRVQEGLKVTGVPTSKKSEQLA